MEKCPLPKPVLKILSEWHQNGAREADCLACSSACCSHSGFAILENVLLIYPKYQQGKLNREDYEFHLGLTFTEFVKKYFDVYGYSTGKWYSRRNIIIFHMRSLTTNNDIITIPGGGNYYDIRTSLFNDNPWLNKGCIFLNKKVPNWPEDDNDSSRLCVLHTPDCNQMVTEKPIDCVFFTCTQHMKSKVPTQKLSSQWFRALAISFPDSEKRFMAIFNKKSEEKET